ncbi:alanine racemase [Mongoliitalea daihaiensis]|uniref:alanine racemase n=1 Tax=Mongoliitalea daihaiensis TaxID=2782006 RepID=UPI001F46AE9D|nr:alanine racemase [Mongoliitalea daihaiensis]UJP63776.1 alanine racemase [Mongoliitalea daihaiensis]
MLETITSPTLLIDEKICRRNISRMAEKAAKHGMELIPHMKTAQSHIVGEWSREVGIREITVSSLKMASYFSNKGWSTIHIAFPFNPREINAFNELASQQKLSIQLVNPVVTQLVAEKLTSAAGFFIEIDAGYGRTGVPYQQTAIIDEILAAAEKNPLFSFRGFYIHPGHSYYTKDIVGIYEESRLALAELKALYIAKYPTIKTRIGDTPGCSVMDDFGDIDQLGPGNFMFYDVTQVGIGSCSLADIAVALAVPIVDIQVEKGEILVHGGGVHLSKDVLYEPDGSKNYGEVVYLREGAAWEIPKQRSYVKSVSQEHGIIKASDELLQQVSVGDLIGILPIHSCMTADCMKSYYTINGLHIDHAEGAS